MGIRNVRPPSRSPARPSRTPDREPTLITSVQRALRLLEAVGSQQRGATAKQLARTAGLPLGTTYHLLRTLTHEGYLRRLEGKFYFGESVDGISRADDRQAGRADLARRMAQLGEELDAPVYFAVYQDGEVRVVDVASGPGRPPVPEWADFRATAHAHAIGLCLLAQLGEEGRRDHLARHPPEGLTRSTFTDRAVLLRRLASAEPTRPVLEQQEYLLGTVCAAVPITVGSVVATMAVSLPLAQAARLPDVAERLWSRVGAMAPAFVL
ncbi:IclR family transcriptional regulator [Kitasatospora sp. McL0602]|uniref:IclR family transcriptional regulator n=1 Tax=Kitasatospora sp. McL0602 TaxID=3439530 RepID=UPI003F8CBFF0